jgi:hypothetical protein
MEIINSFKPEGVDQPVCVLPHNKYLWLILTALIIVFGLSSCVTLTDFESSQDYTADVIGTLDLHDTLGQSFVSRRPSLNGINIWLTRIPSITGDSSLQNADSLSVSLYLAPGDPKPVFSSTIAIPPKGEKLPLTITIPGQKNPAGQSYYLVLGNSSGTIQINGRLEDAYSLGQAYHNSQPFDADIAFRLTYDYGFTALLSDFTSSLKSLWLIFPLLAVLWLPGWLLLDISNLRLQYDFGEQISISFGLSLALIPVLMLWTSVLKLRWTSRAEYIAVGFLVALLIARIARHVVTGQHNKLRSDDHSNGTSLVSRPKDTRSGVLISPALILIFLASLALRLIMVRDLATPAWVDSVHHALLTRLIMENGAYPSTYQPYLDIATSSYHPGFHSIAVAFTWLSQLDLPRSLLVLGQVMNAMCVFMVYLFTKTLTRNRVAGLFAAMTTGFLTPMPAYYTSWGRYTELSGLLLLPVVLALLHPLSKGSSPKEKIWTIVLGALTGGGLFMVHYRVLAFLACLIIAYSIFYIIRKKDLQEIRAFRMFLLIISMSALGIMLVLPWFMRAFSTSLLPYVNTTITASVPYFQDFSWSFLTSALGKYSLVLAGLGLVWGIIQRKSYAFMLVMWIILLFFLSNLAALKLPGGGLISNASVEIMLFIPLSILAGYFIQQLLNYWTDLLPSWLALPFIAMIVLLTGYVSMLGTRQLIPILNPVTILSRSADVRAMDWVEKNIPKDETVAINPFAWGYGLYAGNDGGYWISPLAGRPTLPPPVLYGLGQDAAQISDLSRQVINMANDPAALWDFLKSHHVQYVFLGARGGILSSQRLSLSDLFVQLYHQDGVWIFGTKP